MDSIGQNMHKMVQSNQKKYSGSNNVKRKPFRDCLNYDQKKRRERICILILPI